LKRKPKLKDWQGLIKFAYNALKIRNNLMEVDLSSTSILERIVTTLVPEDLRDVGAAINSMIDFDESEAEDRFVVKPNVSQELDELKSTFAGLDDFLSVVAAEVSREYPFLKNLNVIYFPQIGYLVSLPQATLRDVQHMGWEHQFSTESTMYFKNERMRQMDDELGDLHSIIADYELSMMHRLCETVLEFKYSLLEMARSLSELDCLLSFATATRKYHYNKPVMTEESILKISQGRHPLQELCSQETFIPNDVELDDQKRLIVLTGPNSSGTSCPN